MLVFVNRGAGDGEDVGGGSWESILVDVLRQCGFRGSSGRIREEATRNSNLGGAQRTLQGGIKLGDNSPVGGERGWEKRETGTETKDHS